MSLLKVTDLRKRYRQHQVLQGVSFELQRSERVALLGPNGAGKSTLIKCLSGRVSLDSGSIFICDKRLRAELIREHLGLVPQDLALYGDLTPRENFMAFGRLYGLERAELKSRVDWALEWTGLEDRQHDLVREFSGGMKRRVNLACGVIHSPDLVLLDEPTVGVDPQSRERIYQMLNQLHAEGTAILLTTHHLDEAEKHSDRILILDQGQIVAGGTFDQLVESTIGAARWIRFRIDRPVAHPDLSTSLQRLRLAPIGTDLLETRVDEIADQLPHLIESVRLLGYSILNVEVHTPSLHDVFLDLTGKELRD